MRRMGSHRRHLLQCRVSALGRVFIVLMILCAVAPRSAHARPLTADIITGNETWISDTTINTDVVVADGARLTIPAIKVTASGPDATPSNKGNPERIEIIVDQGGTLIVEPGAILTSPDSPGWGGVYFGKGSSGEIRGATIENATTGVVVEEAAATITGNRIKDIRGDDGRAGNEEGNTAYGIVILGPSLVTVSENFIMHVAGGDGYPGQDGANGTRPGSAGAPGGNGGNAYGITIVGDGHYDVSSNGVTKIWAGSGGAGGAGGGGVNGTASVPDGGRGGDGGNGGDGGHALGISIREADTLSRFDSNSVSDIFGGNGGYGGDGSFGGIGWSGDATNPTAGNGGAGGLGGRGGYGGDAIALAITDTPVSAENNGIAGTIQGGSGHHGGAAGAGGRGGDGYPLTISASEGSHGGSGGVGNTGGPGGDGGAALGLFVEGDSGTSFDRLEISASIEAGTGGAGGDGGLGKDGGIGGTDASGGPGGSGGLGGDAGAGGNALGIIAQGPLPASEPVVSAGRIDSVSGGAGGTAGEGGDGGKGGEGGVPRTGLLTGGPGGSGGVGGDGGQGGASGDANGMLGTTSARLHTSMIQNVAVKNATAGGDGGNGGDGGWGGGFGVQGSGGHGGAGGNGGDQKPAVGISLAENAEALANSGVTLNIPLATNAGGAGGAGGDAGGLTAPAGTAGGLPAAYGIFITDGSPSIYNNIVAEPVGVAVLPNTYGIYADPSATGFRADYNLVYGWASNYGPGVTAGAQDIHADPEFVDRAKRNLHILGTSPARNQGAGELQGISLPKNDFDGDPRPLGWGNDIGADEYAGCVEITGVEIAGPTSGKIGTEYTFTARPAQPQASVPIAYDWYPVPDKGQGTAQVTYHWDTAGLKHVGVDVKNCSGYGIGGDEYNITISESLSSDTYLPNIMQ